MTGNVLNGSLDFADDGLVANYSTPRNIFTGALLGTDGTAISISSQDVVGRLITGAAKTHVVSGVSLAGYDRIGISADFKTAFGTSVPISGSYGLLFIIQTELQVDTGKSGEEKYTTETRYIPILFNSSDMWGNPYEFNDYFTQSIYYDIDPALNGTPVGIDCYFYQNFDFVSATNSNGEPILYPYSTNTTFGENADDDEMILPPNLFVKNINVSFGYATDKVINDTIFLFTNSNNTYVKDNDDYTKDLQARFIYVGDAGTRIAINNEDKLKEYLGLSDELRNLAPIIRWYRYKLKEDVSDARAGDFWEEFYPETMFHTTINDLTDTYNERFKCILCYNNKFAYYLNSYLKALEKEGKNSGEKYDYFKSLWDWWKNYAEEEEYNENVEKELDNEDRVSSDDIWAQWAATDQRIESEELVFTNKANAYDTTRDLVQGLRLVAGDPSNGVFNLYEATYGANNVLINSTDEHKARKVNASFWSAVTEEEEMNKVERLAWYVPRNNTMIKKPEDGKSYNTYSSIGLNEETYKPGKYYLRDGGNYSISDGEFNSEAIYYEKSAEIFLDSQQDIENIRLEISEEEYELFSERINDYYILIDDKLEAKAEKTKTATLVYYIKPKLIKHWTNNTIKASAYRYKRNYEGERAQFTPTFGAKGTNGTDYTLSVSMASEVDKDEKTLFYPTAWTKDDTKEMTLEAQLFDADDRKVENVNYQWEFLYPTTDWELALNGQIAVLRSVNLFMTGPILKCVATVGSLSNRQEYAGYLSIPVRGDREYIALEGPTAVYYGSSGTNPRFYDGAYGLLDFEENINYNNDVELIVNGVDSTVIDKFYPSIVKNRKDDYWHLKPKAMYFKDVNYEMYIKIGDSLWVEPLLILIDPYSNELLNN